MSCILNRSHRNVCFLKGFRELCRHHCVCEGLPFFPSLFGSWIHADRKPFLYTFTCLYGLLPQGYTVVTGLQRAIHKISNGNIRKKVMR